MVAKQHRRAEGGRLVWYAEEPSERFWAEHWERQTSAEAFATARATAHADDTISAMRDWFPADARLLEAGCGPGLIVAALASLGYDIEGVDFSAALIERALLVEPDLPIRHADATALAVADGVYDGVISLGVVEHRREGPEPFLTEARRVLRPGGRLFLTVPAFGRLRRARSRLRTYDASPPSADFFQYGFGAEELTTLVEAAGFRVGDASHYGAHRLLAEEIPGYERATNLRGGRFVRAAATKLAEAGRGDGHMLAISAIAT